MTLGSHAQEAPQSPQQPTPTHKDAPAPEPHPELKPLVNELTQLLNDRKFQDVLSKADEMLQRARAQGDKVGEAHALQRLRRTTPDQLPEVATVWASAFALWREIGDEANQVDALLGQAYCLWRASPEQAQALLQEALQLAQKEGRRPLAMATVVHTAGVGWYRMGELTVAEQLLQQAFAICERVVPNSLQVADTLNGLGVLALDRGDLARAEQLLQQALSIQEKLAPDSLPTAYTLSNLGVVAWSRGDLARAKQLYQQALAIREKLAPNSMETAQTLLNLGNVAFAYGEWTRAEQHYQQALAIYEKLAPNSLEMASTLSNLGSVAWYCSDFARAEQYYQQALAIREKLAPNSLDVAQMLNNLGSLASNRGDSARAEQYYQQALTIQKQIAPNSLDVARTLGNLGDVVLDRGDLARAEQLYQCSLTLFEQLAPNSLSLAEALYDLAILARQQKNYPQARQYLARALEIYETQRYIIPDPETRTAFAEYYFNTYTLQAQLALDQQQPHQAARALERSRARTLAELMHTRTLPIPQNAPKALQDLLAQREQLQREHLLLARQQRQTDPDGSTALQHLHAKARELADRQRRLEQQLQQQFPHYAQLLNPQPPDLTQVQAALAPNTVLLYHALADKELLIVAVSRHAVQGYRVKISPRTLESEVREFQRVVAKPPWERTALERRKLLTLGQRLYATLVKPAAPSLQNATTVLLCPEGALNHLPWGALVVAVDKQGRPAYWIERVALGLTPSAGVYLQAKAVRPAPRGVAVAAVSQYRQQVAQAPKTEQLVRRSGRALGDLPAVKRELASLQRLLGKQGVVVVQEDASTPDRARQAAQNARVVHFACHARADNVDPLGSGLLLAPAGSDAGLLTAAEVVSRWRLRADVVMLSACETAVGVSRRYEGMYGLARAFLYAGSRSVGASLWRVDDVSTALLMGGFYRAYADGVGKAEALRRAQVGLLRGKKYADPYYWSGFVLMGAEQ